MRTGIIIEVSQSDHYRRKALVRDRNAAQKHAWRAEFALLSAAGFGLWHDRDHAPDGQVEDLRLAVAGWQERFAEEGVEGLLRDKTRPSRVPPLKPEIAERVIAMTLTDPPVEATHWTAAMMAGQAGISVS